MLGDIVMSIEGLTDNQVLELESRLHGLVPATGSVGNTSLLRTLTAEGWADERYWAVRQRLMDRGILVTGRGRGGSVKRAGAVEALANTTTQSPAVPAASAVQGADVLELPLASGGRILAVIQGQPELAEIDTLLRLLLARYCAAEVQGGDQFGAESRDTVPTYRDASDPEDLDESELQDGAVRDEVVVQRVSLAPERRPNRDESIEGLVESIILSITPWPNGTRDRTVIVERYGLGDEGEKTLDALGQHYGITRARVGQIEGQVLSRLSGDPAVRRQAIDVLTGWMRRVVCSMTATGSMLTRKQIESACVGDTPVDGWIKLGLDIAVPMSGAEKLSRQLVALADHALHRYSPFGLDCWAPDSGKIETAYPLIEAWLEELEASPQTLPLPMDTFASILGSDVDDVMAVVAAHPRLKAYAGYLFRGEPPAPKKRGVRAHVLAATLGPGAAPVSLYALWEEYRKRFEDIDPCSGNDVRIALTDDRGAPHLFIVDNEGALFALGATATHHGLDLTSRFPAPAPDLLEGIAGKLVEGLRHGPETAEALADRLGLSLGSVVPTLGQRSNFVSVTPRHYGLVDQVSWLTQVDWRGRDLVEEDALDFIACRQGGEDPRSVYRGWTPAFEWALCEQGERSQWDCLPSLLWACHPQAWPVLESEQANWLVRKSADAQSPQGVAIATINRLPDAQRLLRFLLVIRQDDGISAVRANRVTRPRGVREQSNVVLLAMLARVGALLQEADSHWSRHRAGPAAERWYAMLADEYLQDGKLSWTSGACLELVQEAVANPGMGWASTTEWTQRIRSAAGDLGIVFMAAEAKAAQASESDEARGAPMTDAEIDVAQDLLSPENGSVQAAADMPGADFDASTPLDEIGDVAELVADVAPYAGDEVAGPPVVGASAAQIDSISALVAMAQAGDTDAQYRLAKQLQDGIGAAPNLQAATYWLQLAADARHVAACVRLGRMLLTGEVGSGSREDQQQGLVYLNVGTNAGNATASYLVALAYRDGKLTRRNPNAAIRLLKRAARAGHGQAAYALAMMLRAHMDRWVPDTVKLLRLAANKGVLEAAALLGEMSEGRESSRAVTCPD